METSKIIPGSRFSYGEYARWWAWKNRQGGGGSAISNGAGQSLNGVDQYLESEADASTILSGINGDNFSVTLWFNPTDSTAADRQQLFNASNFQIRLETDGKLYLYGGGDNVEISGVVDSNWQFVLVTRDKGNVWKISLYSAVGVLLSSDTVADNAGTVSIALKISIGRTSGVDSRYFTGSIKDVRVYNKDVTSDIATILAHEKVGGEAAWWDLPTLAGFGGTPYDLTGVNL